MRIALILLAAGEAKRMNGKKLQHRPDDKETMLEKVLNIYNSLSICGSIELDKIIITNEIQERFVREKAEDWQVILNKAYKTGMASSIVMGTKKAVERGMDALLLLLADMPYVSCEDVEDVIKRFCDVENQLIPQEKRIIRPYYDDIPGFPVLFGSEYFSALMRLKGDVGAKSVVRENRVNLLKINSSHKGCVVDIDKVE